MDFKEYINKQHLVFTSRGNSAILQAPRTVREHSDKLFIQDEGGWMTYEELGKKAKYNVATLKTDYGLLHRMPTIKGGVLLINSLPGYTLYQDMALIMAWAQEHNVIVINDVAGSIVYKEQLVGNILIGSFGRWKPLNVQEGGFIASDTFKLQEGSFSFSKNEMLATKLLSMHKRTAAVLHKKKEWMDVFAGFSLVSDQKGFNFYVLERIDEAEQICKTNYIPYTLCPRYIRTMRRALCVETKRLF